MEDDTFLCEQCNIIFDIEESVKPDGKKGKMICIYCFDEDDA